jgi:hypothetical protein
MKWLYIEECSQGFKLLGSASKRIRMTDRCRALSALDAEALAPVVI